MKRMILILFALFLNASFILGQTPAVNIPLTVQCDTSHVYLMFGLDPSATDGYDGALDEEDLWPMGFPGVLDARFILPQNADPYATGSHKDYRQGTNKFIGTITSTLRVAPGIVPAVQMSWDLPYNVSVSIKSSSSQVLPETTIEGNGGVSVSLTEITTFTMTIIYSLGAVAPNVPELLNPSKNALGVSLNPTLSWNASEGAANYELLVATDAAFSNIVVSDLTLTALSKQIGPLTNSTKYYWKVRAKNVYGTSSYSEVWNFTTVLGAPVLTSPANNSSNQPVNLSLSWSPVNYAANYRLQVSKNIDFSAASIVINDSLITTTSKEITGLEGGIQYFWRVCAKNSGGSGSYSSIWSFSTALANPVLLSPANNSLNLPNTLTLSWNPVANASKYRLQVSTSGNFNSTVFDDQNVTATSKEVPGLTTNTKYYWRVSASSSIAASGFSEVWNFTTVLGAPVLTFPANNSLDQPTNLTFSWQPVANASTYRLQVAKDNSFSGASLVHDIPGISEASKAITGLEGGTKYYWQVKAENAGGSGAYSTVWSFTTGLPSPLLQSPVNNSLHQPATLTLSWNSVANAIKYRLQVSTSSNFSTTFLDDQNVTATSKEVTGLNSSTKYYWRVNASSTAGTSPYSEVWNFTTILSAPVLVSPADKSTDKPTTLTLSWNTVSYAESYSLQVSTLVDFSTTVFDIPSITTGSKEISGLEGGKKYYWRVKANNAGGSGPYSAVWDFTTALGLPGLSLPSNNAMQRPLTLTLSWNPVQNAATYDLLLSTDPLFLNNNSLYTDIPESNVSVGPLDPSTKYYWKVRAKNANGNGAYSPAWMFITILEAPEPLLPANNSTNLPTKLTFSWNTGNGTESHRLQIATDPNFATIIYDDSLLTTSSTLATSPALTPGSTYVTGLLYNTLYYWRVKVKNAGGSSAYSEVCNFKTREKPEVITPALESPEHNSVDQPTTLTFKWIPVENTIAYRLQISIRPDFLTTVFDDSTITSNTMLIKDLMHKQVYYWRVLAKGEFDRSPYSDVWKFTTEEKKPVPVAPVLESPANNACGQPLIMHLSWKQSPWAESYTLQVSKDQDFKTIVFQESTITLTSDVITGLSKSTRYYWRVKATNHEGSSPYSAVWTFMTELSAPELLCPANNSTGQPTTLTLSWKAAQGADTYWLQVATDECFANIVYNNQSITKTSQEITGLSGCTKYYWKVSAKLCGGCSSEFSTVWNFTTAPKPCNAPSSLIVTASAYGEVKLVWKDNSDNEVSFKVYRKDGDTLSTNPFIMIKQLEANQTSYTDKSIKPGVSYTYKISAINSDSVSSTCAQVTIKTVTSVMLVDAAPGEFNLCQNYPNPFNPSTLIRFTIKEPVHVKLTIFNQLGEVVSELFNEELSAGTFERSWNADNVPSGFYFYELRAGSYISVKKMLLLK